MSERQQLVRILYAALREAKGKRKPRAWSLPRITVLDEKKPARKKIGFPKNDRKRTAAVKPSPPTQLMLFGTHKEPRHAED